MVKRLGVTAKRRLASRSWNLRLCWSGRVRSYYGTAGGEPKWSKSEALSPDRNVSHLADGVDSGIRLCGSFGLRCDAGTGPSAVAVRFL